MIQPKRDDYFFEITFGIFMFFGIIGILGSIGFGLFVAYKMIF